MPSGGKSAQTEPAHSMRCDAVGGVWAKSPGLEMELARRESSSRARFRRPEHRLVHRDQRKVLRTSSLIEILNCPTTSSDHKAEMWDSGRRYGARAGRQVRLHGHGCCSADELQKLLPRTESLDFRRQGELWGGEEAPPKHVASPAAAECWVVHCHWFAEQPLDSVLQWSSVLLLSRTTVQNITELHFLWSITAVILDLKHPGAQDPHMLKDDDNNDGERDKLLS
ncbi:hypothetical protein AXG93_1923s1740 [Marchantia polymorpha subsp. ruderalis]|uniref:Uncharacterized protein n=1 Tax=Marchantia polymorpha subsp. ruderalis TaxID=1480154 RepID=A0A176VDG5_MARPO|nr:hypothetical protein AXG93_1923s1740 [Marchantia polymorpha subsp. ruderalis]